MAVRLQQDRPHAPMGSVRVHASRYRLRSVGCAGLITLLAIRSLRRGSAEEVEPAGVGGNMLMRTKAGTEEVAQFIVVSTEPVGSVRAHASKYNLGSATTQSVMRPA